MTVARVTELEIFRMDCREITREEIREWKYPGFQRDFHFTRKVQAIVEEIKVSGVLPGTIVLGVIKGQSTIYILDGQHRLKAFLRCGRPEVVADIKTMEFPDMAAMWREYKNLAGHLAAWKPDDFLRGCEIEVTFLQDIRKICPFVGYQNIRRVDSDILLSMTSCLRSWAASKREILSINRLGDSVSLAEKLTETDVQELTQFLNICYAAWRTDPAYFRLWGSLNQSVLMWLWRRQVLHQKSTFRATPLSAAQFLTCLQWMAADPTYPGFLLGRTMNDDQRDFTYHRIKGLFSDSMRKQGLNPRMPQPEWPKRGKGRHYNE